MASFNNTAAIDAYYAGQRSPIEAQIEQETANYERALQNLEQSRDNANAERYRSFRRIMNDLPSVSAANGIQGGMADSAVASIKNQYLQGRGDIEQNYLTNKADQDLQYGNTLTGLRGKLAQLEQEANADKYNLEYAQAMAAAGGGGGGGRRSRSYRGGGGGGTEDNTTGLVRDLNAYRSDLNLDPVVSYGKGGQGATLSNAFNVPTTAQRVIADDSAFGNGGRISQYTPSATSQQGKLTKAISNLQKNTGSRKLK